MATRIYVKNLPFCLEPEALESALREVLTTFGEVKSMVFVCEGTELRPKGLCFAELGKMEEAKNAVRALHGIKVAGYRLQLGIAKPVLCRRQKERTKAPSRVQQA